MSVLLAPYNNAMRLGQGFNSYTQQICIDDAVVVDPNRAENVVTNDGTTMRIMAQKSAVPSAWTRQKEVITENPATAVLEANAEKAKAEVKIIKEQLAEAAKEEELEAEIQLELGTDTRTSAPKASKVKKSPQPESKDQAVEANKNIAQKIESANQLSDADDARRKIEVPVEQSQRTTKPQGSKVPPKLESHEPNNDNVKSISNNEKTAKPHEQSLSSSAKKAMEKPADSLKLDEATSHNLKTSDCHAKKSGPSKGDIGSDATAKNLHANVQSDDKDVDHEGAIATVQVPNDKPKEHGRGAISDDPSVHAKGPVERGVSADRAHQSKAETPAGPPDRDGIRAALLKTKQTLSAAKSTKDEAEDARREQEEKELLAQARADRKQLEKEAREDARVRREEDRKEQALIREEKRKFDAARREASMKAIENAANLKATGLEDLAKIRAQNQFVERFSGMNEQTQKYDFDPTAPRGPSQTVTYTSRFVDRLSDVLDDMSVSGSLSIKAGKVGGSGKGSFVDSDKFKESDLNFWISVKVVNQTINFKDALVYNPLKSVDKENFQAVYGDSFISGFVEGGEFNALVSMKILNKAKKTDIQAEAKIALTAGAVQIEAEANVGIARSNIETNTETTIQVSWSGGGHIKPMEQQWDIQSLMAAAARFPDLVAECPQRTYAILTKYDTLRSFVARKPEAYTPLQYENAQIYTNALLDSFVSYKALYKRLGEQIFQVQGKTMEIRKWSDNEQQTVSTVSTAVWKTGMKDEQTGLYPFTEATTRFEASLKGLSDARTAVRRQMARIVNEVSLIEQNPKLATDEDHAEPFQAPVVFEARIPPVEIPAKFQIKTNPLSGRRLMASTLSEEEQKKAIEEDEKASESVPLFTNEDNLNFEERNAMQALVDANPLVGQDFRVSRPAGDDIEGQAFNSLEILKPNWRVRFIKTEMDRGALVYLAVSYDNGLLIEKGSSRDNSRVKKFGPFYEGERINSASIEHGKRSGEEKSQVLGIRLFTNRGRGLIAHALESKPSSDGKSVTRDGVDYREVNTLYVDVPFQMGSVKGFFGRSDDGDNGKIWRLGLIWCRTTDKPSYEVGQQLGDAGDLVDSEDLVRLKNIQNLGTKTLEETKIQLDAANTRLAATQQEVVASKQKLQVAQRNLEYANSQIEELKRKPTQNMKAQRGQILATESGWKSERNTFLNITHEFDSSYPTIPKMIIGMNYFTLGDQPAVGVRPLNVTKSDFSVQMLAFNNCLGHDVGCSWMTLPDDLHLEHGIVEVNGSGLRTFDKFSQNIVFSQQFSSPPKVVVWFQEFDAGPTDDWISLNFSSENVSVDSFTLRIDSWMNRRFRSVRAGWFAYPSEEDGRRVKSGKKRVERTQILIENTFAVGGSQPFSGKPATFGGISMIDFGRDKIIRVEFDCWAWSNTELYMKFGTREESNMHAMEVVWIALE